MEGFHTVEEGQRLEFEVEEGAKVLSAKQVKPIQRQAFRAMEPTD
jgi:cold shock CspA family protein